MVYRKRSDLIDWFIRNHPDRQTIPDSRIGDDYERTNVWRIQPNTNSKHPAAFPLELAKKVIRYYDFKHDVVLDPFAGSGTVGAAAAKLGRRFALFDINPEYVELMRPRRPELVEKAADNILWVNCDPAPPVLRLFKGSEPYDEHNQ